MTLTAQAIVESVGGGSVEFRLVRGGMVNLPATREEEQAFAAYLYSEVTITVSHGEKAK